MKYKIIFYTYATILLFLILFKFSFTIKEIQENILIFRTNGYDKINIELFKTIKMQIDNINESWAIRNLLGNTIPFVLYGLFYQLAYKHNFVKTITINLIIILLIETIQYTFAIGTFDIDDILLNIISISLGMLFVKEVLYNKKTIY
ncbi:MAG: VanZ family protein [bacterium]